jgi:hypothetical protein
MKKWKIDRIISVATLVSSALALFLVLKKPQPVAPPQPPAVAAANAQSFQTKVEQFEQAKEPGKPPAEIRLNSEEVGAALMQAASTIPMSSMQPASAPGIPTSVPSSPESRRPQCARVAGERCVAKETQRAEGPAETTG